MFDTIQCSGNTANNGETGHHDSSTQFNGNRTDNGETRHQGNVQYFPVKRQAVS